MLKRVLIFTFFSIVMIDLIAQKSHFGIKENEYLSKLSPSEMVSILVKGEAEIVQKAVKKHQAIIKYAYQDIFAISLPKNQIELFAQTLEEAQIELPTASGVLLMDTAIKVNKVEAVHMGLSPLPNAFKGTNVIVGILDSGIYFNHADFKKADGSTRIRYIWDQNLSASAASPMPYAYGTEWSWIDIDNGLCNHVEPVLQYGHGTTVAGAACGNGNATGYFTGVAPEAEIIVVAVDYYGSDFLINLVDAVDYVFKKADALGKPCVINTSLGTYFGSHDGKDLATQMIEALIAEKPGRAVVASAGNGNNINQADASYVPTHLAYNVTSDTAFTWFKVIPSDGKVYFDLWADTADFKQVNFAFQNDHPTQFIPYGKTPFLSIATDFNVNLNTGVYHTEFVFDQAMENHGKVDYYIEEIAGRYHLEFLITPDSTQHLWRFMTTGSGTFDVWSSQAYQGTSNMVSSGLPPSFVLPEMVYYKLPDNKKTVVSSWQCSEYVLTVGNYSNRAYYYDIDSTQQFTNETPGEIFFRSSEGPTRDNRLKPDITATGNQTFATGNIAFINSALSVNRPKVAFDGLHARNGGTSMSAPIVAGVVALYLQKNPTAPWYEIKEAIIQSALRDSFTGPTENTQYGYGKLDAFALLQFEAVLGCMDSLAFNFNAIANVDDGSCIPVVLGCTDSLAFNFNHQANTDDGSCIPVVLGCTDSLALNFNPLANVADSTCAYETPIHNLLDEQNIIFSPNPLETISYLYYFGDEFLGIEVKDVLGKTLLESTLSAQSNLTLYKNQFANGIYFIEIQSFDKNWKKTIKFVVH
jgi:subtilisin family serine protease